MRGSPSRTSIDSTGSPTKRCARSCAWPASSRARAASRAPWSRSTRPAARDRDAGACAAWRATGPRCSRRQPRSPYRRRGSLSVVAGRTEVTAANARHDAVRRRSERDRGPATRSYLGFDRALDAARCDGSRCTSGPIAWQRRRGDSRAALIAESRRACARSARPTGAVTIACAPCGSTAPSGGAWSPLADGRRRNARADAHRFRALHRAGRASAASARRRRYFIRCRIVAGRFECPPRLVHVALQRGRLRARAEPRAARARAWRAATRGATFAPRRARRSSRAATRLRARRRRRPASQADWREVADWDRAGAHDRVFRAGHRSAASCKRRRPARRGPAGRLSPAGDVSRRRRRGRQRRGGHADRRAGQRLSTSRSRRRCGARRAARGRRNRSRRPAACASRSATRRRAPSSMATAVDKAVTLDDIERLALATPGVPVARARADRRPRPGVAVLPGARRRSR